jgi:hypothetical protein
LPPWEMKSLYGSITRSAVISFSYVTLAMLPSGYAVTQVDQRVSLRWRCQRLSPCDRTAPRVSIRLMSGGVKLILRADRTAAQKITCACVGTGKAAERSGRKTCPCSAALRTFHSQLRSTPAPRPPQDPHAGRRSRTHPPRRLMSSDIGLGERDPRVVDTPSV